VHIKKTMYIYNNIEVHSGNHYGRGNAINNVYGEYVFATLIIQHAVSMHYVILSDLLRLVIPNFSTLSHKWYDFREKKVIGPKIFVLIFRTTCV